MRTEIGGLLLLSRDRPFRTWWEIEDATWIQCRVEEHLDDMARQGISRGSGTENLYVHFERARRRGSEAATPITEPVAPTLYPEYARAETKWGSEYRLYWAGDKTVAIPEAEHAEIVRRLKEKYEDGSGVPVPRDPPPRERRRAPKRIEPKGVLR